MVGGGREGANGEDFGIEGGVVCVVEVRGVEKVVVENEVQFGGAVGDGCLCFSKYTLYHYILNIE